MGEAVQEEPLVCQEREEEHDMHSGGDGRGEVRGGPEEEGQAQPLHGAARLVRVLPLSKKKKCGQCVFVPSTEPTPSPPSDDGFVPIPPDIFDLPSDSDWGTPARGPDLGRARASAAAFPCLDGNKSLRTFVFSPTVI